LRALLVSVIAIFAMTVFAPAHATADRLEDLAKTLESDPSEKARISAAVGLGNLADPRGIPALVRALSDRSPSVRGLAASALGHIRDPRAVSGLERALGDHDERVRTRAREALTAIRGDRAAPASAALDTEPRARTVPKEPPRRRSAPRLHIVVNQMGTRSTTQGELPAQMRSMVLEQLGQTGELSVGTQPGDGSTSEYIVDGSIMRLQRVQNGQWVEVTCEVRLTVSNGRGSIMSIVSGGATVQASRRSFRKEMEPSMQREAMENAVRGAYQNLMGFLVRQIAQAK
jgi:HEAT repeats